MAVKTPLAQRTELALLKQALENMTSKLASIEQLLKDQYVQRHDMQIVRLEIAEIENVLRDKLNKEDFALVQKIVYGVCAMVGISFFGGLIALVIRSAPQ